MTTHFTTKQIRGLGRGKFLGYPTINMEVPVGFELADGIYATWVTVDGTTFRGAMHWGAIPTFDNANKSLEVFLLGVEGGALDRSDLSHITVVIVKKLREVIKFPSVDALTQQIARDVLQVRRLLRE